MSVSNKEVFICSRCGKCCLNAYIFPKFSKEEWIPILDYIKKEYNGILSIIDDSDEYSHYKIDPFNSFFKHYKDDETDLFWSLDSGRCPFIKYDKEGIYFCEIHEFKPEVCRGFKCNINKEFVGDNSIKNITEFIEVD